MNSIDSITKKITQDANAAAQEKVKEAQEEAKAILADYKAQAEKIKADARAASQKEADALLERVESQAALAKRNLLLQNKRASISRAFDKALEQLCAMDPAKQLDFLSSAAAKYQSQDATILLNKKDQGAFGEKLIPMIQEKLKAAGKDYKVSLSKATGNFAGGLVLIEGSIETNISYEVLIKNIRDEIENDVAKVLYE